MAFWKSTFAVSAVFACTLGTAFAATAAAALKETPSLAADVAAKKLPPVTQRVPTDVAVANLAAQGRKPGKPGGVRLAPAK